MSLTLSESIVVILCDRDVCFSLRVLKSLNRLCIPATSYSNSNFEPLRESDIPKKAGAVERACRGSSNQARRATYKSEGWRGSFRRHSIRSTRALCTIRKPRHVREPSTYPNSRSKPMPYKGPQRADSERIAIHFSSLLKDSRCYLISFIRLSFLAKTAS